MEELIAIDVEGRQVTAAAGRSIIEAIWDAGYMLVQWVGCLGQGVCGSCRVMIRRADSEDVNMALACETVIEPGMQVSFVPFLNLAREHPYKLESFQNTWQAVEQVHCTFPEAVDCRHCGGCDAACPKGIDVQHGVELVIAGELITAGNAFESCIMCDLCSYACPEFISPNHVGLLARRLLPSRFARPANLMRRLRQVEQGELRVDDRAHQINE